jgi:hypothetical protein
MVFRRKARSLAGTAARTAVIAGTATAVSGRVANRQRQKFTEPAAPPPQAAAQGVPANADGDLVNQLQRLADLKTSGVLTDKEFAAAKARLLHV